MQRRAIPFSPASIISFRSRSSVFHYLPRVKILSARSPTDATPDSDTGSVCVGCIVTNKANKEGIPRPRYPRSTSIVISSTFQERRYNKNNFTAAALPVALRFLTNGNSSNFFEGVSVEQLLILSPHRQTFYTSLQTVRIQHTPAHHPLYYSR